MPRYIILGFDRYNKAPIIARYDSPAPICDFIILYSRTDVTAKHGRLTINPANPVLNKGSIRVKGRSSKWGRGSHDVPNCSTSPGSGESTNSLDLTKCDMESL